MAFLKGSVILIVISTVISISTPAETTTPGGGEATTLPAALAETTTPGGEATTLPADTTLTTGGEGSSAPGGEGTSAAGEGTTPCTGEGTSAAGEGTTPCTGEGTGAALKNTESGDTTSATGGEETSAAGGEGTSAPGGDETSAPGGEGTSAPGGEGTSAAGEGTTPCTGEGTAETTAGTGEETTPAAGEGTTPEAGNLKGQETTTPKTDLLEAIEKFEKDSLLGGKSPKESEKLTRVKCLLKNETFTRCRGHIGCQPTLQNPDNPKFGSPGCPLECVPGCKCRSPKVKNEETKECVDPEKSPDEEQLPENETLEGQKPKNPRCCRPRYESESKKPGRYRPRNESERRKFQPKKGKKEKIKCTPYSKCVRKCLLRPGIRLQKECISKCRCPKNNIRKTYRKRKCVRRRKLPKRM